MIFAAPKKLILFGDACHQVTDPIAKASRFFHLIQVFICLFFGLMASSQCIQGSLRLKGSLFGQCQIRWSLFIRDCVAKFSQIVLKNFLFPFRLEYSRFKYPVLITDLGSVKIELLGQSLRSPSSLDERSFILDILVLESLFRLMV